MWQVSSAPLRRRLGLSRPAVPPFRRPALLASDIHDRRRPRATPPHAAPPNPPLDAARHHHPRLGAGYWDVSVGHAARAFAYRLCVSHSLFPRICRMKEATTLYQGNR